QSARVGYHSARQRLPAVVPVALTPVAAPQRIGLHQVEPAPLVVGVVYQVWKLVERTAVRERRLLEAGIVGDKTPAAQHLVQAWAHLWPRAFRPPNQSFQARRTR